MDKVVTSFELYAEGKGLIVNEATTAAIKQTAKSNATLPGWAWIEVQEVFTTLTGTGDATNYASAGEALDAYFVPQVNSALAR